MKISGRFSSDDNFITVYSNSTIYTITKATKEWASRKIGEHLAYNNAVLTPEIYKELESRCTKEGTFVLADK